MTWIILGFSFVGTPPVRKAFSIKIFNSLKLFFPLHFRDTKNNISHNFYSFNLTVGLLKMTIFLLLNILSIPIDADISRTNFGHHTGYFWNFPISHIIQNYWKKQVLLKVFQSQFNCGTNTIVKISSSKLKKNKLLARKWLLLESSSRHRIQNNWKNKILVQTFQLQFNCGNVQLYLPYRTLPNRVDCPDLTKLPMISQAHRVLEKIFGAKMSPSENFQFHMCRT